MIRHLTTASAIALLAAGGAAAQSESETPETAQSSGESRSADAPVALSSWNYDRLYAMEGIRGEAMLDAEAYGENGEEVGDIENVWIRDNRIIGVTVETDGFLDIGDTHVIVPFDQISFEGERIVTPLTDENVGEYDAWSETAAVNETLDTIKRVDDGGAVAAEDVYRLTDVMDDYALAEGVGRGYIDDVLFSRDGALEAVVFVGAAGYRAAPYYGPEYGYDPFRSTYRLRYDAEEIEGLEPFEYDRMENGDWF